MKEQVRGRPRNLVRGLLPDERGALIGIIERVGLNRKDFKCRQVKVLKILDEAKSGKPRGTGPGPGELITHAGKEGWYFTVRGMRDAYRTEGIFDFECDPGRVSATDTQTTKSFHIVRKVFISWARTILERTAQKKSPTPPGSRPALEENRGWRRGRG